MGHDCDVCARNDSTGRKQREEMLALKKTPAPEAGSRHKLWWGEALERLLNVVNKLQGEPARQLISQR